ncbi:hypothetical protein JYU34_015128 [Plutella xylostella]|uniref:Uncharacterized protein n=1 Tax=Plutella xylostella TaxID=51655 RepID=A0ABQ7Q7S1_PLUXY|nr:hypothetical protein JYU34_015128 [Plutella xylostella]
MLVELMEAMNLQDLDLQSEAIFEMYINLVTGVFTSSKKMMSKIITQYNLEPVDLDWTAAKQEMGISDDQLQILNKEALTQATLFAAVGIYLVLMGKQLTSNNYTKWIESRIRSFAAACEKRIRRGTQCLSLQAKSASELSTRE